MNDMGVIIRGLFIGSDVTNATADKPARTVVGVAVGLTSYKIYLDSSDGLENFSLGDVISVSCRPYAGRNGSVGFSDGKIII